MEEDEKMQYPPRTLIPDKVEYPLPNAKRVTVYVDKIYGCCPMCVEGDKFAFDLSLLLDETKISSDLPNYVEPGKPMICPIAMKSFYPYILPLSLGVSAVDLGIAKKGDDGYVICPAWGPPTCEALIIWRLHPEPTEKSGLDAWYEYLAKKGHISVPAYLFERFAPAEAKEARKKKVEEWVKAGKPKFWEGWRNLPCQPRRQ